MKVNIVGAGLAGLSAAITLAERGVCTRLFSVQPSERAQSVMAEGGINGALNTMGENDSAREHFEDTMRAGCGIADDEAVYGLTHHAASVIEKLETLGVPFNRNPDGSLMQRNFGGQKKKRTAFAKSSTGKIIMTALIDEARRCEVPGHGTVQRYGAGRRSETAERQMPFGTIERFCSHEMVRLIKDGETVTGVVIKNTYTGEVSQFLGPVILAYGGLNGFFPGRTTGTTANSGEAAAIAFSQGVVFSNLEMIQFHPTTIQIPGKRCLISEAARGEGGRLFIFRDGKPWYFMEEKYPTLGNLMPRDVVSREMYFVLHDETLGGQVYLDLRGLSKDTWKKKLPDLRQEIMDYLGIDPAKETVPVEPGIHYFMGGIDVDAAHRTNFQHLYAAGECCSLYHGANRLGGNSLLGAIYGGMVAAETACEECGDDEKDAEREKYGTICVKGNRENDGNCDIHDRIAVGDTCPDCMDCDTADSAAAEQVSPALILAISDILYDALGIVRNETDLNQALGKLEQLSEENADNIAAQRRIELAKMMILSALARKESRGAHYRSDFPNQDVRFKKYIKCDCSGVIDEL